MVVGQVLGRSWAGQDGKYLRKSTPKNHPISSKLFYLFQLNLKKKKTIPLTPISTFIDESSCNRQAFFIFLDIKKLSLFNEKLNGNIHNFNFFTEYNI